MQRERQVILSGSSTGCRWLCAGIALGLLSLYIDGHAQEPWYYTLGKEKERQQANLCSTVQSVLELALVFEQQGPRPGYAALDRAHECSTRVQTFTPLALVKRVPIKTGDGGQYVVSFVKVKTSQGAIEYLVTTRDVRD